MPYASHLVRLLPQIKQELIGNILPWWMQYTVDHQNGGFYGAVTNDLRVLNDVPRSVVLCARMLWTYSAAYRAYPNEAYLRTARHAFDYLTTRFWDAEYGGVYWMLDKNGQPVEDRKQLYGQGFAIYGLSEYFLATGDPAALQCAQDLFHLMVKHAYDPVHGGYVEARSRDWSPIADLRLSDKEPNCTKSMNTMLHIVEPFTNLVRAWDTPETRAQLEGTLRAFLDHVIDPQSHTTRLFFDEAWNPIGDHVSFGHDIEASWLIVEAAEALGDEELIARTKRIALEMAEAAQRGLDADGSMLYEATPTEFTIVEKHWWPQAEGMVGFFNAAQIAAEQGNAALAEKYAANAQRLWEYIAEKMVDHQHGDWFKRLSREGVPIQNGFKAGPWDCPYHHARACLEMIRRLGS